MLYFATGMDLHIQVHGFGSATSVKSAFVLSTQTFAKTMHSLSHDNGQILHFAYCSVVHSNTIYISQQVTRYNPLYTSAPPPSESTTKTPKTKQKNKQKNNNTHEEAKTLSKQQQQQKVHNNNKTTHSEEKHTTTTAINTLMSALKLFRFG